ncbi:hypothetical protein HYQ46_004840 [Verticillium longisporum]|nr:hypothetical protein HYQ46_004840 [Verticillium longisporum]
MTDRPTPTVYVMKYGRFLWYICWEMRDRSLTAKAIRRKSQKRRATPLGLRRRPCSSHWIARMTPSARMVAKVVYTRKSPYHMLG